MAIGFSQQQRASQVQAQRLSQKQIQSLNLLSMNAEDLRDEILAQVEKNPALEIVSDDFQNGLQSARYKKSPDSNIRVGSASSSGEEKSDAFQEILESRADERKSLFSHLAEQLNFLSLDEDKKNLCQKLIGNLDSRGFFILAPSSLLDQTKGESPKLLDECLSLIQSFDPPGICVENVEKSLLLQARLKGSAPQAALFLLDGHFDFLDPPQGGKVLEKIQAFVKEQEKLKFGNQDYSFLKSLSVSDAEEALSFIRTLDPFPAREFLQEETRYVSPDIYVERIQGQEFDSKEAVDLKNKSVCLDEDYFFKVKISDKAIPRLRIASDFSFAKSELGQAKIFLESLEYRENTMAKAALAIVQRQAEFFKKGPGHLLPLRQQDLAEEIGVHESTVSRMASSKYLQCQWGLFPIKYFFSSAVSDSSKESVLHQIKKILENNSGKKMSDQKLSDELLKAGIKVARRTVAKYRAQLNIDSSYTR